MPIDTSSPIPAPAAPLAPVAKTLARHPRPLGGDTARNLPEAKPRVILFDTLMGKGVPFLEAREKNHFIRVDPPEWQQAIDILDQAHGAAR